MKKDWLLLLASVITTLVLSVGVIRWLAPGLLGIASDLQLVQLDEKAPPFYKGILKNGDTSTADFILKDPLTRVRARPFFPRTGGGARGPNDLLGFRNNGVPNVADVITIGDSMTYGNNALMENNWPGFLQQALGRDDIQIYNMATGGWAAVQYLDMMNHAEIFRPRVVIVAFYSGNDPLESFQLAYGSEHWNWLIPDTVLTSSDMPKVESPPPRSEYLDVTFKDGVRTVFTPTLRLASNDDSPVVSAGYSIMGTAARLIAEKARQAGSKIVFTVIPTKELVYATKMQGEGITLPDNYKRLVKLEHQHIIKLANDIGNIPGALYVDVASALQRAAMNNVNLYPDNMNGHPVAEGYRVIGEQLSKTVKRLIPATPRGLYAWNDDGLPYFILVNYEGVWLFESIELIEENGWPEGDVTIIESRELSNLSYKGMIKTVDRRRFGPGCCTGESIQ
jgi:lysophospholipase L1-like esterase